MFNPRSISYNELNGLTWNFLYNIEGCQARFRYLFRRKCEAFSFEIPYTDSEIYRKIRFSDNFDFSEKKDWLKRLSNCKETILRMLFRNERLAKALDRLLVFPGLWTGLQLGNFHKHIALHCEDHLIQYLHYTFDIWSEITGQDNGIAQAVDADTVCYLQSRFPSGRDRTDIQQLCHDMKIFPEITNDAIRGALQNRILGLKTFIPSIETFHRDVRYLSLAVISIKNWIAPDIDMLDNLTVSLLLRQYYKPWNKGTVEVSEDVWELVPPDAMHTVKGFNAAYLQILLAAFCRFANLTHESPIQESRGNRLQGTVDPYYVSQFQEKAYKLGFLTPKVEQQQVDAVLGIARRKTTDFPGSRPKRVRATLSWSGGKLYISTYLQLHSDLFYQNIMRCSPPLHDSTPSPVYIMTSLLVAFLGKPENNSTAAHTDALDANQDRDMIDEYCKTASRGEALFSAEDSTPDQYGDIKEENMTDSHFPSENELGFGNQVKQEAQAYEELKMEDVEPLRIKTENSNTLIDPSISILLARELYHKTMPKAEDNIMTDLQSPSENKLDFGSQVKQDDQAYQGPKVEDFKPLQTQTKYFDTPTGPNISILPAKGPGYKTMPKAEDSKPITSMRIDLNTGAVWKPDHGEKPKAKGKTAAETKKTMPKSRPSGNKRPKAEDNTDVEIRKKATPEYKPSDNKKLKLAEDKHTNPGPEYTVTMLLQDSPKWPPDLIQGFEGEKSL